MPRPRPTGDDQKRRKKRADEWRKFRRDNLFTQKRLAEVMSNSVGEISRRTIQQIEAGRITPHPTTLRLFAIFKKRYQLNAELEN